MSNLKLFIPKLYLYLSALEIFQMFSWFFLCECFFYTTNFKWFVCPQFIEFWEVGCVLHTSYFHKIALPVITRDECWISTDCWFGTEPGLFACSAKHRTNRFFFASFCFSAASCQPLVLPWAHHSASAFRFLSLSPADLWSPSLRGWYQLPPPLTSEVHHLAAAEPSESSVHPIK